MTLETYKLFEKKRHCNTSAGKKAFLCAISYISHRFKALTVIYCDTESTANLWFREFNDVCVSYFSHGLLIWWHCTFENKYVCAFTRRANRTYSTSKTFLHLISWMTIMAPLGVNSALIPLSADAMRISSSFVRKVKKWWFTHRL